eukprot:sb/3465061/
MRMQHSINNQSLPCRATAGRPQDSLRYSKQFELFRRPQQYLFPDDSYANVVDLSRECRQVLIDDFFSGTASTRIPSIGLRGVHWLKSGKKSWRKMNFIIRDSAIYYAGKAKNKGAALAWTSFARQLMVTVVPGSVSSQLPCTDPSTVNPGHTENGISNFHERKNRSDRRGIGGDKSYIFHFTSAQGWYTFSVSTVTELVVQNLDPVTFYIEGGSRLSNCPNLVYFLWWLYWENHIPAIFAFHDANVLTPGSRISFDLERGALQIKWNITLPIDDNDIFLPANNKEFKKEHKAPTEFCFLIRTRTNTREDHRSTRCLCVEDELQFRLWTNAIRRLQHGANLRTDYDSAMSWLEKHTEESGQQRACLSPTLPVFSENRESIVMPEMDDNAGDIFAARFGNAWDNGDNIGVKEAPIVIAT